ncbi:trypsin-like peptidase domain-containing protein [Streptomyces sp. MP131-18]|uniref:VMAP-C domain-containing protein n=1 Tax=Streptomyces sp. MP131-18 TaxID=1857892 RepID=UPI00097BDA08|nr:trypsin-like peptidase domain-containing protein [Streptomyces sp. MP131-18]ONK12912.1 hypothetical protein STBA_36680 [Streptomyces sp. MP131-18]
MTPSPSPSTPRPADPRHSVVSVLRTDDGKAAGAGVLLAGQHLLTCAHVVNDAIGRGPFDGRRPGRVHVPLVFHGPFGTQRLTGRTVYWVPPRRTDGSDRPPRGGDLEWLGDLAVLHVPGLAPDTVDPPAWTAMREGQDVRAWHGTALPGSFSDARIKSCDERVGYLDGEPTGMSIGPAYSGGPLWSGGDNAVVGIVAAHSRPPDDPVTGGPPAHDPGHVIRRSWSIPWQRIERELRAVGAQSLFHTDVAGLDDPAYPDLCDLLDRALGSSLNHRDLAAEIAERCGTAPPREGHLGSRALAHTLLTEPRALAALSEILHAQRSPAAGQLVATGQWSAVPLLLSPGEHRRLLALLAAVPAAVTARIPQAVRAALPTMAALPATDDTAALLLHLERFSGDGRSPEDRPRVPALLRLAEYLAVVCPPSQRAGLRLWCDGVGARLGIPRPALRERRADADDWAAHLAARSGPPRVLVGLATAEDGHRLRIWCDEGDGPRQVSGHGDRPLTAAAVAEEVLRVLEPLARAAPGHARPLVEVLVDRAALDLPVDEWESPGPDGLIPGVLGAEYPLVVHCPELLRRHERFLPDWRHRWRCLDTGETIHVSDAAAGARAVYGTLMDRLDAVRVTVDVPARVRSEVVQVCIAVGVPVVVWDRGTGQESHAVRHASAIAPRELPEGVRSYRAKTVHRPDEYPGRPVLAWADADRPVPVLHLSDPMEAP